VKSIRISDGEFFRINVAAHSGEEWPIAEHLAATTGVLAGRDGPSSRGIYCETCRFGFRREFGPFPLVEARTSLANDFTDEAHRRECEHWKAYVEHPQAFAGPRAAGVAVHAVSARPEPADHVCARCAAAASALFRCLDTSVCFRCLGEVLQLTGGYSGFKSLLTVEEAPEPPKRRRRREPGTGRCRTCRAFGKVIPIHGNKYCRSCATARVEKLLTS
jgi:hypothetical protein